MFRVKKGKTFIKNRVIKLIKKYKNNKLKFIIENDRSYPNVRDSTGMTLLHLAAKYDNMEILEYLIGLGCDVNAKDSSGTTPLMVATKFNHCSAIRTLIEASADIFIMNSIGEYPLQIMFNISKKIFYSSIMKLYYEKVKMYTSNNDEILEILLNAGCTLDQVVILQDYNMTQMFLDKIDRFDEVVSCRSVLICMFLTDRHNLELLLHTGSQMTERREDFLWYLHDVANTGIIEKKQLSFYGESRILNTIAVLTKKLIDWQILEEHSLKFIKYIFEDGDKEVLQVFLESDIVSYVVGHFSYNLLVHVFGNPHPDIIELLQSMNIELPTRANADLPSVTALHLAVHRSIPKNVKFLLDMGVNPNIMDDNGETPLLCILDSSETLAKKMECVKLLLKRNADVQTCDIFGRGFIEYVAFDNKDHLSLVKLVLAHLAMLEAIGYPTKQSTMEYINSHGLFERSYSICRRQLQEIKVRKVCDSFSLLKVLDTRPSEIARFVSAQIGKIIATLVDANGFQELNSYYVNTIKERLNEALKINRLRNEAEFVIGENILILKGYSPVMDKIISFFDSQDLLIFSVRD